MKSVLFCLATSAAASFFSIVSGESLYDYLFTSKSAPPTLSRTLELASKEKDRIANLMGDVSGGAFFLPTNQAWAARPDIVDVLLKEAEGNVRFDMILAAAAAVPPSAAGSYEALRKYAEGLGGVVDSAYGTPYFIKEENRVCLAEWASGSYVEGDCAQVVGQPIKLADATIFPINKVLISSDLEDHIEPLVSRRL